MQEPKARSEMDPTHQWDLSHIFVDTAAWEAAYTASRARLAEIEGLRGTLGASAEALAAGLRQIDEISMAIGRVVDYAFLLKAADASDPAVQEMEGRAMQLAVAANTAASFVEPEILEIPEERLLAYIESEVLTTYRHTLEDINRARKHTLDAKGEEMLAALGEVASTPRNAFDMLTNVDMELPSIRDEKGNAVQLTSGSFSVFRESGDRAVREAAFEGYFGTYRKYINTIAALYAGSVKMNVFRARARHYHDACEAALFPSNVPVSVYDALVSAVHDSLPEMQRYLELRKHALELDRLDVYDLYAPMVKNVDYPMPYEKAKLLVREALAPLGEDYCRLLDRAFSERWIDVYENKGKESGAFSAGVYGVHPYIKLNYTDTLDDAFTLAHELGHAMHSYYSAEAQDYANHDYHILVAEVASTVNEVLLTRHLLSKETDSARRAYLLNHFLEGFRTTVFRQTLFAEFERRAHELSASGGVLTADSLSMLYGELEATYYSGVEMRDAIMAEWSYIPHFYRAFYVYQYATGFSAAVAIADGILESGDASAYRRFLTLGGSDYPLTELKVAGVDLTSPEAVRTALRVFGETVTELKGLLAGLK